MSPPFPLLLTDNPKEMTRVSVYVRILDVNDNAPQFAVFYDTFVCENARAGQVSHLCKCNDKTKPFLESGKIVYERAAWEMEHEKGENGCQQIRAQLFTVMLPSSINM